ncbi:MAG: ComF family protein [Pseudomonadota bacterium]
MHPISIQTKRALLRLTDAIWPQRSLVSGEPAQGALSASDFAALTFITGALCNRCGQPMDYDLGPDAACGACIAAPPRWDRARAALVYDDVSRVPILALKRAGRRDGLQVMANWMRIAADDLIRDADAIIPVPLHYHRLVARGYNQAGWLASAVARGSHKPVWHGVLKRSKSTPSQAGLSARARHRNVSGAFSVPEHKRKQVVSKRILLVDDVLTTGATLGAACQALKNAHAAAIDVVVLARVVRERDATI